MDQQVRQGRHPAEGLTLPEETLFIVKPDAVARRLTGRIIARFEDKGFEITRLAMLRLTKGQARVLLRRYTGTSRSSGRLVSFITSGPVVACTIRGNNAVATTRIMVGATKSYEAAPGSIRGDLGLGLSDNVIHASDSAASFRTRVGRGVSVTWPSVSP